MSSDIDHVDTAVMPMLQCSGAAEKLRIQLVDRPPHIVYDIDMPAKSAIPNQEDFSVSELVELFGIAERTIQYWLSDKRAEYFPNAYRQGREANSAWRIPRKDVVAFDKRRRGLT